MKSILAVIAFLAVINVRADATSAGDTLENQFIQQMMQQPANQSLLGLQPERPNEVKINGFTYSGILVQLSRTDNPLELINPAAPLAYGSPEDNVVRDPITGKVSGLKLFSISF
jgi:hypothetical protein